MKWESRPSLTCQDLDPASMLPQSDGLADKLHSRRTPHNICDMAKLTPESCYVKHNNVSPVQKHFQRVYIAQCILAAQQPGLPHCRYTVTGPRRKATSSKQRESKWLSLHVCFGLLVPRVAHKLCPAIFSLHSLGVNFRLPRNLNQSGPI